MEFAIVMPLLIALVWGIYTFGLAYNKSIDLTGAAREGARVAALNTGADPVAVTKEAAPAIDPDDINVTVTPSGACTPGEMVTVTASVDYTYVRFRVEPLGSESLTQTITGKGAMRCGG